MQGSGRYKPQAAVEISTSDEASHLTLYLQKQLEDDIARIFDESIYPDLELVCGKLKILTHACILKTRSSKFYDKFESFLHVNIDRKLFDEIYSFISDSYTECDIKRQEREILSYLEKNFVSPYSSNKATEEHELFLTPKCLSPSSKRINEQKSLSSSPSIELTKEYYSLVPIEGNILDKELIEQDVLSNAFQSIQKNETEYSKTFNKPTTLPLGTNLACKSVKHSNSCDSLTKILSEVKTKNGKGSNVNSRIYDVPDLLKKASGVLSHRIIESKISPDSLVTDDPSSSSDYLSAANASPGFVIAHSDCQSNVCTSKMENPFTSSDSGLEITGQHESLNSNRDTTSIDIISLTENILHESNASSLSQYTDNDSSNVLIKNIERSFETLPDIPSANTSENNQQLQLPDLARKTTKEEKQKHNEEIVTLESSSLSSEAGSWESVFPPKRTGNDSRKIPTTDLHQSPKVSKIPDTKEDPAFSNNISKSLVQKSPFKSTSCFIDAASLADEEEVMRIETDTNGFVIRDKPDTLQLNPSQPVPCSTFKHTISPQEKSECNDNDDSLEQTDNKDPESIQKDLSPTIFEMTPITEDSLCSNVFEAIAQEEQNKHDVDTTSVSHKPPPTVLPYTPYNSILSVNPGAKQYDSESETDTIRTTESEDTTTISVRRNRKTPDSQPIVSGGASVEDHLPQVGSYSCSPAMKRKLESSLIVSGGYMSEAENLNIPKSPKPISSWIVNMSIPKVLEKDSGSEVNKRPIDKTCESLKSASKYGSNENCSKSRSSIDSDSSERSGHTFYIDLSTLPDTPVSNQLDTSLNTDKKNIFSMYIGLEDSPRLKEMPPRLLSSINNKKQTHNDTKSSGKANKKEINEQPKKIESQLTSADAFETIEMLCQDPNLNLSEIISAPTGKSKTTTKSSSNIGVKKSPGNLGQIKENVVNEEINPKESEDLFVRLSDLDKPAPKVDLFVATQGSPSTRMTRSIPDDNWNNRQKPTSRSIEVINSFHSENAESLNRLFPHLKNEFSASMPGSLSGRTKSTLKLAGDVEEPASDVSEFGSSVESSMCRSYIDSATEDTSEISTLLSSCQSRLGQELLRMFLQEIAPDVVVEVSGRRIKAHKCILASRCQYFAGILSGGWVESSGNVIVLPPFSYNVVHFALCHIYSGVSTIPDWVSIVELATIADMLGLEGLKEAIMYTLKAKYCHHFHKPCQVCTAGVLECFPLSSVYGLDDLYRKCLRWITKHFSKVWPTKAFATLPKELLDKCYQQHIVNLNLETLVSKVFGCGMILSALENCRWADSVARMCRRLLSAAAQHVAPRLVAALRAVAALPPGVGPGAAQALDDCFAAAFDWAPPDEACRAYAFLTETCTQQTLHHYQPEAIANGHPPESFDHDNLLYVRANCWRQQCEGALIRAALRVVSTQAFKVLPADLKKRLRALCCVKYGGSVPPASPHTPLQGGKNTTSKNKNTQNLIIDIVKTTFVPYSTKPVKVGSVELSKSSKDEKDMKIPKGQPPKIRMTKAQEERAKYNLLKTNQYREHTAANKLTPVKPRIDHVKAKYSQPRMNKCLEIKPPQVKKLAPKMMSSSESSRNSSPSQARKLRNCRLKSPNDTLKLQTMSQDSLATTSRPWTAEPSTDSLSESQTSNKYATYTKTKHIPDGQQSSSESVKTGQSQITSSNCNKKKSKIPVSCNHPQKNIGKQSNTTQLIKSVENISRGNKLVDRRVPASLMSATKSSSAKIVPKVMKEIAVSKSKCIKPKQNKKEVEALATTDIPVMERSGTFMKDEPTFCDKTIDIDPINGIK